ncbi:MAG: O-methyltransferase [Rhodanobacter sp.]
MSSSSARYLPYEIRPCKQTERRLLLDYLACAKSAGLPVATMPYIGMGGIKFYDFILMHKFVGVSAMTSLEHDAKVMPRCEFNRPYEFITVINKTCGDYLSEVSNDDLAPATFWLDYDGDLSDEVKADIQQLGTKVKSESLIFVTVASGVPLDLVDQNENMRLASLREQFGDYALSVTLEDVENSNFPTAIYKILVRVLKSSFAARTDCKLDLSFQVAYSDGKQMLTVGGLFAAPATIGKMNAALAATLPFLSSDLAEPFWIVRHNLSERERTLFDFASTTPDGSPARERLLELGFKEKEIQEFTKLMRFVPRYFEAII